MHKISIQWHITTNCNNRCRHCYMFDEKTYAEERKKTLSDNDLLKVLESITDFEKKYDCVIPSISVTGGDPLQRNGVFGFLSALTSRGKSVSLMGNPETLTKENLRTLEGQGIKRFQMSLDGLEPTHDYFRSKGSFRNTVNKISALEDAGIQSEIMFTLYPENKNELIPLIKYLASSTPLSIFRFDFGTASGNASNLSKNLEPLEVRGILESYLLQKDELKKEGCRLRLYEKVHLFSLLHFMKDNVKSDFTSFPAAGGCLAGWYSLSILSDGTVFPCRRLPVRAGKMPEQSFEEIFLGSELLKKMRRRMYYKECGNCALYEVCRGCPAYVYGLTGDPFSKNPLCFKENGNRRGSYPEPGLDTTFKEEFNFISSAFHIDLDYLSKNLLHNKELRGAFLTLLDYPDEMTEFLAGPEQYLNKNEININPYEAYAMFEFLKDVPQSGLQDDKHFQDFIFKLKMKHIKSGC